MALTFFSSWQIDLWIWPLKRLLFPKEHLFQFPFTSLPITAITRLPDLPMLGLARENSKQRDNKVDHQKGDHVVMRLRAARRPYCCWIHGQRGGNVGIHRPAAWHGPHATAGTRLTTAARIALRHMAMCW